MKNCYKFSVMMILVIVSLLCAGCSDITPSQDPLKNAIKVSDTSYSTRTNILDSTKTYTVTGIFTNTGSQPFTFYAGLTLFDSDYKKFGGEYKGETITLAPGESKTVTAIFITDISKERPSGISYKVEPANINPTLTSSKSCAVFVEGKYSSISVPNQVSSATLETIGNGNAQLILNSISGTETYAISYYPAIQNDPCQGIYDWKGISQNNEPISGNFLVIGRNPDKIGMFNDAWGNFDKIEFSRQ